MYEGKCPGWIAWHSSRQMNHLTFHKSPDKSQISFFLLCNYIDLFIPVAIPESDRLFNHAQSHQLAGDKGHTGNLWIKRRKLLNKLWTALITICYQICVMMNLWDTYWPKCIWQHSFPLFLFSFITYLVDSHALTTKRTARSTHKQMQNDFKHCVLRIPSYTFWRIFGFICSSLAKYT